MNNFKRGVILALLTLIIFSSPVFSQDAETPIWPKDITTKNYTITLYQPENASYLDNSLKSNIAFAVKEKDQEPKFGMLWTTSLLDVDRDSRIASLASVKIDEIRYAEDVTKEQQAKFQELINKEFPKWNIEFPLDDLLAQLEEVSVTTSDLNNTAPKIIYAQEPTAIILIDGTPKFREVEKGFELVENTGAFIIKDQKSNNVYLKGGEFWYESKDAMGPWKSASKIPSKIKSIAKKAEPEKKADDEKEDYSGNPPAIKIVTEPTELIVFEGEPNYSPLQGTNLLFVENTTSDIFMDITSQTYYVLLSGRWFKTKELKEGWNFVDSVDLPDDFLAIDKDSKKGNVLSSIAGTKEAKDAIYDAQIPQTAAVKRDTKATTVEYNGNPEFKQIEGLKLEYAVNTESSVFKDKKDYYLCDNAVWFKSTTPNGPWVVADARPEEIDKIPADNPKYNTKYVYIYETSPTVVYVGYTPGYYGTYVYGPTVVYGTGFYYNPWYGGHYYHHHYSYGFSVRYNPYYGWSFGFSFGSPYGWYGHAYWGHGYHHWGPPYYRPPYYYGNRYRQPSHPIYRGRSGVNHYNRPATRPGTRPSTRPGTRPSTNPATRPSTRPTTRPSTRPNTRPANNPTTRPSSLPNTRPANNPTTRPSSLPNTRPSTNPSTRPTYTPNTRPTTRPSAPSSRPAARPTSRPSAMPSSRPASRPSSGSFRGGGGRRG